MLSMFTVTGQIVKIYSQSQEPDKETGEIHPDASKIQIMGEMPVKGGDSRFDLISLKVENPEVYQPLKGKRIRVPLGFFAPSKDRIIYYIPKGAIPEIVT